MKKLLVVQHVAFEILGTLNPLLKSAGFRIRYVNFGRHPEAQPCLDRYHGLVVLGGPMNADQFDRFPHLETEVKLIENAIDRDVPVLGICLGAQLIAMALGAEVKRNPQKEIGWYDVSLTDAGRQDPLFAHFEPTERIFQWHGDTFCLPKGCTHLASSPTCANQAFRYRSNVYGLQFHMEVDEPLIERWLRVPIHRREIEALNGAVDPETIRQETTQFIDRSKALSDRTFSELIKLFGAPRRRVLLPSR
jgi:GMP synthase (glutamine-hydrolysing)